MAPRKSTTTLADRLRAELTKAQGRIEALELERDRFGGAWSSAEYEAAAYRRQRDEVVGALAALLGHLPPAEVYGTPGPVARARELVERYRRPTARIEAP